MDREPGEKKTFKVESTPDLEAMIDSSQSKSKKKKLKSWFRTNAISGERNNPRPGLRRGFQPQE